MSNEYEGLNVPSATLTEFFDDLEGRLALLTGLVKVDNSLTLEDIRKPLLVVGKPGIGKTCGIMSIRKKLNERLDKENQLGFKKILLGQTVVGSMSGIPVVKEDGTVVRIQVPDLPDEQRDGKYGILFLDEITTADEAQVQPALGLCDDSRCIGTYKLPEHWLVVAAGNGPDCTNFVRLDDMTISRFSVYDVSYDYKKDWRPWAHANNVESDIIAFLNFDATACVRVESDDMDNAGKLFPCPRTWERLSTELKMRSVIGKPVSEQDLANFAGRVVGTKAGREFAAFYAYHTKVNYSPEKIITGEERDPQPMEKQVFHILIQACIKLVSSKLEKEKTPSGSYTETGAMYVVNMFNWVMGFERFDFENCMETIFEIRSQSTSISEVLQDADFYTLCPKAQDFFERNAEYIFNNFASFNL